jgi:hypothetical protein
MKNKKEKLIIDLENFNDKNIKLIKKIKNSNFTNNHKYKQCYFESNKIIGNTTNCCLPCDIYCFNRIKNNASLAQ